MRRAQHTILLPPERSNKEILGQAEQFLAKTLAARAGRNYMLGDLSAVDFMPGHACYLAGWPGCMPEDMVHLQTHVKRLEAWPTFDKGIKT